MSKYKLLTGVYFGDKLFEAGQVVELDESQFDVEGYVERGSIALYDPSEEQENAGEPADEVVAPVETEEEVVTAPVNTTDPTPEQIAADFQAAGVETSPDVPQPN